MQLCLGVDGGGTRTRMVLVDAEGRVLGRGEAGLANLHHASEEAVLGHLSEALRQALASAGGTASDVGAAFLGMAGVTTEGTAERFRRLAAGLGLGHARVGVDHDIRIALAGGLAGRPGIALIVGTGSSCYGRDASGRHWQTGGWGSLVADEGSGYDLGRRAIVAAVRMSDGRLPDGRLREKVFEWLGVDVVSRILERLYERGIERNEIAAFAPEVIRLAEAGDGEARSLLEGGAADLADLVAANHHRLPTSTEPEVVITGGLGTAPTLYRDLIRASIRRRLPEARVRDLELEPVAGAALLALELLGVAVHSAIVDRLRRDRP